MSPASTHFSMQLPVVWWLYAGLFYVAMAISASRHWRLGATYMLYFMTTVVVFITRLKDRTPTVGPTAYRALRSTRQTTDGSTAWTAPLTAATQWSNVQAGICWQSLEILLTELRVETHLLAQQATAYTTRPPSPLVLRPRVFYDIWRTFACLYTYHCVWWVKRQG